VKTVPLIVLAAILVLATTTLVGADRKYEKKYQVSSGGTLVVNTDQGSVNVVGTGGTEVSILVELRGGEGEVENFEITSEQTSSGVEVQGRRNKSGWSWLHGSNLDAQFTINVPREYHLKLRTSGGDVDVKNVKGRVEIHSTGKLHGSIVTPILTIEEGGILEGHCKMEKKPDKEDECDLISKKGDQL